MNTDFYKEIVLSIDLWLDNQIIIKIIIIIIILIYIFVNI